MRDRSRITNIVFDLGGVIIHGELDEILPHLAETYGVHTTESRPAIMEAWTHAMVNPAADEIFWDRMTEAFHCSRTELIERFISYPRITNDVLSFLPQLQHTRTTSLLSNQIRSWLEPFLDARELRPYFSHIVTSYETGVAKPDQRIYQALFTQCAAEPSSCLFIDDRAENIVTARHLGMQTIHLFEPEQLGEELRKVGVL